MPSRSSSPDYQDRAMTPRRFSRVGRLVWLASIALISAAAAIAIAAQTQIHYDSGQTIAPVFEGWDRNPDGSFNMVFGYMNRNYEEILDVPVGAGNSFEPGTADQGQPTHFFPRRQQFMFKVRVPADWGKKDLVWTLTFRGHTEKAFATLAPFSELDYNVYHQNRSGPGAQGAKNEGPAIRLVGETTRTIAVGEPLALAVAVTDDGLPELRPVRSGRGSAATPGGGERGRGAAMPPMVTPEKPDPITQMVVRLDPSMRLGTIWILHRRSGSGEVTFSPAKSPVENEAASTTARFSEPGSYTIRAYADDGILLDYTDINVTVTGPRSR
jgi:hypothetical protein